MARMKIITYCILYVRVFVCGHICFSYTHIILILCAAHFYMCAKYIYMRSYSVSQQKKCQGHSVEFGKGRNVVNFEIFICGKDVLSANLLNSRMCLAHDFSVKEQAKIVIRYILSFRN
jgi:hypothetical protein